MTQAAVALSFKISRSAVAMTIKRVKESGTYTLSKRCGRPRATTKNDDKYLLFLHKKNRSSSAADLQKKWNKGVCRNTVRSRLNENGIRAYVRTSKPSLTKKQMLARYQFCRKYATWTKDEWRQVVFSDESKVQCMPDGGLRFVWRTKKEKHDSFAIRRTTKHPVSAMVWAAVDSSNKSDLHVIEGKLNAQKYQSLLEESLLPFWISRAKTSTTFFQQDNAPCHTAASVSNLFMCQNT